MELLADRDPEEARKLLDPVLEQMLDAVHRYEEPHTCAPTALEPIGPSPLGELTINARHGRRLGYDHSMRMRLLGALAILALTLAGGALSAALAQPTAERVRADAREIRAYRLSADGFRRFTRVAEIMDGVPTSRAPGAVRADSAFFVVLAMGFAHRTPWSDGDVAQHVQAIESGFGDLATAIRDAGFTPREYVLTQMTLLLAHPTIARKKRGLTDPPPTDIARENLAFVESHWAEVDAYMTAVLARIGKERGGS